MARWSREEIEEAMDKFRAAALKGLAALLSREAADAGSTSSDSEAAS